MTSKGHSSLGNHLVR